MQMLIVRPAIGNEWSKDEQDSRIKVAMSVSDRLIGWAKGVIPSDEFGFFKDVEWARHNGFDVTLEDLARLEREQAEAKRT